jgi:hypothetical protein
MSSYLLLVIIVHQICTSPFVIGFTASNQRWITKRDLLGSSSNLVKLSMSSSVWEKAYIQSNLNDAVGLRLLSVEASDAIASSYKIPGQCM